MRLGVNIDHVATLREARGGVEPDPAFAALIAESNGADSIVAHLREDRRHIKENDLFILKGILEKRLNLEMSVCPEIVDFACKLKPFQATLVPERRQELTTEGGLDILANLTKVKIAVGKLMREGIRVSIFVDPVKSQINSALKTGAYALEFHTGSYANSRTPKESARKISQLKLAASFSGRLGFAVFAGHGLNYTNVSAIKKIPEVEELNIGHAIISRAVFSGLGNAVREMKELLRK